MPRVGFEPMIPVFERAKTSLASDRVTTVIGHVLVQQRNSEVLTYLKEKLYNSTKLGIILCIVLKRIYK
jgi:hypothetical protein